MAQLTKHVGIYGGKPCVVIFRELPDDTENALIIQSNTLDGQMHDDVMSVIDSREAQESNEVSEVLHRRRLTDGENMLTALHNRQKLQKVPVSMVTMTPFPNQEVSLTALNAEIRKIHTGSNPPLKTEASIQAASVPEQQATTADSDPTAIAQNLLTQATLLDEDAKSLVETAESKRQEAYSLDPALRPKKGPGRPPKATVEGL